MGPRALNKAWEYGASEKLLMILSNDALQTSHCVIPIDTPNEQLEGYQKEYRTLIRLEDKGEIYLSRLDAGDRRIGSDYELAYCRFPIGDPRDCLVALVVVLPPDAPLDPVAGLLGER